MPEEDLLELLREAYEAGKLAVYYERRQPGRAKESAEQTPDRSMTRMPTIHEGWHH